MTITITLSKDELNAIDLSDYKKAIDWCPVGTYFDKPAGEEFFRLLAHISKAMPDGSIFVDMDASVGMNAAALAVNEKCSVISYDVYDHISDNPDEHTIKNVPNVTLKIKDCLDDVEFLKKAAVVIIDIDPHDGVRETETLDKLREVGFRGIAILDDINVNEAMSEMWKAIPESKIDLTTVGHWSGTGAVLFSEDFEIKI